MNPQKLQKLNDAAAKFETKPEPKAIGGSKIQNSPNKMEMELEEEEKVPELTQKLNKTNSTNTGAAAKSQAKSMQKSATQKSLNNTASSESNISKSSGVNAQAGKKPATKVINLSN